jgi:ubiquinone/menaquinone biosynthesis C-methylase UbiE
VDLGCGSGKWAIEVAQEFSAATVQGFDLSPVRRNDIPANCHFSVGDMTHGLPYEDGSMDFIQSR